MLHKELTSFFLHVDVQLPSTSFWRLSLPHWTVWSWYLSQTNIIWPRMWQLYIQAISLTYISNFMLISHYLFFFLDPHSIWKFPRQGSNPNHSSNNIRFLTARLPRNSGSTLFWLLWPCISFEIRECGSSSFIFLVQDYIGHLGLRFYTNFRMRFFF